MHIVWRCMSRVNEKVKREKFTACALFVNNRSFTFITVICLHQIPYFPSDWCSQSGAADGIHKPTGISNDFSGCSADSFFFSSFVWKLESASFFSQWKFVAFVLNYVQSLILVCRYEFSFSEFFEKGDWMPPPQQQWRHRNRHQFTNLS